MQSGYDTKQVKWVASLLLRRCTGVKDYLYRGLSSEGGKRTRTYVKVKTRAPVNIIFRLQSSFWYRCLPHVPIRRMTVLYASSERILYRLAGKTDGLVGQVTTETKSDPVKLSMRSGFQARSLFQNRPFTALRNAECMIISVTPAGYLLDALVTVASVSDLVSSKPLSGNPRMC